MGSEVSDAGSLSRQKLGHLLSVPEVLGIATGCGPKSAYAHALD